MTFYIRKDHKAGGYVLVRVGYPYEYHSHFKTESGCHQAIRMIDKRVEPAQDWLREAIRRVLTAEEFKCLKKTRDKYHNKPRRA